MYLKSVKIYNFKNIASQELLFSPKLNCITGNNGEGKTNLLDSIHYLCMTKSYFNSSDHYSLRSGENEFSLNGEFVCNDATTENIQISLKSSEKSVRRNGKTLEKISSHIGRFPVVMISPDDSKLVNGGAESRRRLMNTILCQLDKNYLHAAQRYNTALDNRNRLLKSGSRLSTDILELYDSKLSEEAYYIYSKRAELVNELLPLVGKYYAILSANGESTELKYISSMNKFEEISNLSLKEILADTLQKDITLGYTSTGVHRDDIDFSLNGLPLRQCASQGQQKTFCVSLRLAQYTIMSSIYGLSPILLLDDVFDKLDMSRVEKLLDMVASTDFGQIFISDCNYERTQKLVDTLNRDAFNYRVNNGIFELIQQ